MYFLYIFRATMCPSSGETTVFMRQWYLCDDCLVCIPDNHPHRVPNAKCRINTFVSPDDGHIVSRNIYRKEIDILIKIVHQVGSIYKIIQGCAINKT